MPIDDREKIHKLEDLKTKLFSKSYEPGIERRTDFRYHSKIDVADSWQDETNKTKIEADPVMKKSIFKKFFIFSIIFFALAMIFAGYEFFLGGNTISNDNIDISVLGNTFAAGGENLPLQVEIVNKNDSPLELADLVVEYPNGDTNTANNTATLRTSIGTIPAGATHMENVSVVLFGEQGSTQDLKISLEYRVENSNAIFVKETDFNVSISSAPINLTADLPTEASPDQEITLDVKATLNATQTASKMMLKVDYPVGFQFEKAVPAPTVNNDVWSLGDLAPGAERDISITGKLVDVADGESKTFHIWSGSQSDSDPSSIGIIFNSLAQTINIKKPFIEAQLYVNGAYQSDYVSDSKTSINGDIHWTNNLDTKVDNLKIVATISGNEADPKTIFSDKGFYNSATNTLTWDQNSDKDFVEVAPGASGVVSFSLAPLPLFSANGLVSEPSISVNVSVSADQPLVGNATQSITNSESKTINIISDVNLKTQALYYSGAFTNTGPIPATVGQPTTYTIVWTLSNTANNISGAHVISTLPPWIDFVGPISPPSENLTYNPSTRQIDWNIGGIPPGTGISVGGRSVSFQITFTPSLSQVGTIPLLINDAILTGHDDFANVDVTVDKPSINTDISGSDTSFGSNDAKVIQ